MTQPQKTGAPAALAKQPVVPALAPGLTAAHFTSRELETLRKACRDSDFEHLWRDFVQPALNRAEGGK